MNAKNLSDVMEPGPGRGKIEHYGDGEVRTEAALPTPQISEEQARQRVLIALHELECVLSGLNGMERQAVCTALDATRPMFRKRSVNTAKTTDPIWDSRNDEE